MALNLENAGIVKVTVLNFYNIRVNLTYKLNFIYFCRLR